ncbi:MAG: hypothetical protein LC772_02595 [Chloroflexi bacterium]|nr:hypothetical protein [Chloroflexota bacterium]
MHEELRTAQTAQGACFTEYYGRQIPASFAGIEQECAAVRETCGLFDLTWRSLVRFTGPDRAAFLHSMSTNNVLSLEPDSVQRNTICDATGHLLGVIRLANTEDALWAEMHPGCRDGVIEQLNRHLVMEAVEIADLEAAWGVFSLQGPAAAGAAARIPGEPSVPPDERLSQWTFNGQPVFLIGSSHTGSPGVDVIAPADSIGPLWDILAKGVIDRGGTLAGFDALNVLRVEAGVPWWSHELDSSVLMLEAGLDDAIRYDKGCYVGQETLARVYFRGHTNRQLSGLLLPDGPLPEAGVRLRGAEKDAGRVTSAVRSPAFQRNLGLGFVRREFLEPGSVLELESGGNAVVARLPFEAGDP